ncbi:rCG29790 [Rattus norvegicus]|uniref:RCG29790 n=1 Tax=Rattus norvegicus TaxID=10116 RepID=A6IMX4_RAT|nr:rCG29790 [Rattus norvegicus]
MSCYFLFKHRLSLCVTLQQSWYHCETRLSPPTYYKRSITQLNVAAVPSLAQRHPGSPHLAFNVNLTFTDTNNHSLFLLKP